MADPQGFSAEEHAALVRAELDASRVERDPFSTPEQKSDARQMTSMIRALLEGGDAASE